MTFPSQQGWEWHSRGGSRHRRVWNRRWRRNRWRRGWGSRRWWQHRRAHHLHSQAAGPTPFASSVGCAPPGTFNWRWIHGRQNSALNSSDGVGRRKVGADAREVGVGRGCGLDGEGGKRRRAHGISLVMKIFLSTRVLRDFQLVGNTASSFHRDETFLFSLLSILYKKLMWHLI